MSEKIEYLLNIASAEQIAEHLSHCDSNFMPALSVRIKIEDYANKIVSRTMRFEAWTSGTLVGLVAAYCNDHEKCIGYITSVSVLDGWGGKGIATRLVGLCVEHVRASGIRQITLQVASDNAPAIKLYGKNGFIADKENAPFMTMVIHFKI